MNHHRPTIVVVLAVLAGALAAISSAAPAAAHAELVAQYPADGASLDGSPRDVSLQFSEPVTVVEDSVVLRLRDQAVAMADVAVDSDGRTVRGTFRSPLAGGHYGVTWRVLSGDDHVIEGSFSFHVVGAAGPTPATADAPAVAPAVTAVPDTDAPRRSLAPLLWGTSAAVVAVALTLLSARRRSPRTSSPEGRYA